MKLLMVLLALVGLSLAMPTGPTGAEVTDSEWTEFKTKHSKVYNDAAEDAKRRQLYAATKQKVEEHNKDFDAGKVSYNLGLNQFADLTDEESKKYCCGKISLPEIVVT